jgi:hypothetical protein
MGIGQYKLTAGVRVHLAIKIAFNVPDLKIAFLFLFT